VTKRRRIIKAHAADGFPVTKTETWYNINTGGKDPPTNPTKEPIMAKSIEVLSFTQISETSFTAAGICDDKPFVAATILWGPKGEKLPIFKVQEVNEDGESNHLKMAESKFNRGERIAIARKLKMVRLAGGLEAKTSEELAGLTLKELRSIAKERGVSGTHRKGITKAEVVELLAA
jgi:hypothetical protein